MVEDLELRDLPHCSRGVEVLIIGFGSSFLKIGKFIFRGPFKLFWLSRFRITLRFFLMGEE